LQRRLLTGFVIHLMTWTSYDSFSQYIQLHVRLNRTTQPSYPVDGPATSAGTANANGIEIQDDLETELLQQGLIEYDSFSPEGTSVDIDVHKASPICPKPCVRHRAHRRVRNTCRCDSTTTGQLCDGRKSRRSHLSPMAILV
jgi:hypothetical protein